MVTGTYEAVNKPLGYRQLTVSTDVVELADATGGVPVDASKAIIAVETQGVRTRDDGGDPTSSAGMPYASGSTITLVSKEQISAFKAIRSGENDATLSISYYKV